MESAIQAASLTPQARQEVNKILAKARLIEEISIDENMIEEVQHQASQDIRKIIKLFQ